MNKVKDASQAVMSGILWREMRNYIIQTKGDEKLDQLLSIGTPALKKFMHRTIMATSNSSGVLVKDFYYAWQLGWPDPTGEACTEMLRWVAGRNLKSFMTIYLIESTPHIMAMNFPRIWDSFFNYGELKILEDFGKSVIFEVVGSEAYGEAVCRGTIGWTWQAINEVGGKNIRIEHPECRFLDHDRCLFKIDWE